MRIRDTDANKEITFNMDGGAKEDDNDNEGGVGFWHQNLTPWYQVE